MASDHDHEPLAEDEEEPRRDASPDDAVQAQRAATMLVYPVAVDVIAPEPRRGVKKACTNCRKACKRCDTGRPCQRCVTYGIGEECIDHQGKPRMKGAKKGPSKKRARNNSNSNVEQRLRSTAPTSSGVPSTILPAGVLPMPYATQMSYPNPYYGQYAGAPAPNAGEAPAYYQPYYFVPTSGPHHQTPGHEDAPMSYGQLNPHYHPPYTAPHAQSYHNAYRIPPEP